MPAFIQSCPSLSLVQQGGARFINTVLAQTAVTTGTTVDLKQAGLGTIPVDGDGNSLLVGVQYRPINESQFVIQVEKNATHPEYFAEYWLSAVPNYTTLIGTSPVEKIATAQYRVHVTRIGAVQNQGSNEWPARIAIYNHSSNALILRGEVIGYEKDSTSLSPASGAGYIRVMATTVVGTPENDATATDPVGDWNAYGGTTGTGKIINQGVDEVITPLAWQTLLHLRAANSLNIRVIQQG